MNIYLQFGKDFKRINFPLIDDQGQELKITDNKDKVSTF